MADMFSELQELGSQLQWMPIFHHDGAHPFSQQQACRFRQSGRRHGRGEKG